VHQCHCTTQAYAFDGVARKADTTGSKPNEDVMDGLRELEQHLVAGARHMATYCGRGFLMRFITSSSDEAHFLDIDGKLQRTMQVCGCGGFWLVMKTELYAAGSPDLLGCPKMLSVVLEGQSQHE